MNLTKRVSALNRFFTHIVLALTLCLYIGAAALAAQTTAADNGLLWEISGKGLTKPSYLFGTFHLLNDSYLPQKQALALEKFQQADGVVVEIVPDTPAMMQAQMKMLMPNNRLSNLLDSTEYSLIAAEVKQHMGMEITALEQIMPMGLSIFFTIVYSKEVIPILENYTGVPLDIYFGQTGQATGKTVTALETVGEQFDLLFGKFTPEEQADQLVEMIQKREIARSTLQEIADNYLQSDLQGILDVSERMQKEMPAYGSMEYITTDRNKKWMEKLPALLQQGSLFIAVGALHLPGKEGLIDLLRKAGYSVKPVRG